MELINKFSEYDIILQILIILAILLIVLIFLNIVRNMNNSENFESKQSTFRDFDNNNLFDNFYTNIYDKLHNDDNKNNIIINIIKKNCNIKITSTILDIGCGTGEIVSKLSEFNIIGLDKSSSMIKLCKEKYPENNFILADILNNSKLNYNYEYSHVLCLNYTIYYIDNRKLFFRNIYDILLPNGIFVLHLVNKQQFNRTINKCKIDKFNPSKYLDSKPIKSNITFDEFDYNCIYKVEDNKGIIDETFSFKNSSIRKNTHTLILDNNRIILNEATNVGFIIEGQIKINKNDGEYLFILKKNL
tara:strand:+ start:78 stop:983 length:906 start_codon:yes stop_codon:yes gene_type:complete